MMPLPQKKMTACKWLNGEFQLNDVLTQHEPVAIIFACTCREPFFYQCKACKELGPSIERPWMVYCVDDYTSVDFDAAVRLTSMYGVSRCNGTENPTTLIYVRGVCEAIFVGNVPQTIQKALDAVCRGESLVKDELLTAEEVEVLMNRAL